MKEIIKRLKELEAKAAKGPWSMYNEGIDGHILGSGPNRYIDWGDPWERSIFGGESSEGYIEADDPNALFVIELRNALPKLLNYIEKLEQENKKQRVVVKALALYP